MYNKVWEIINIKTIKKLEIKYTEMGNKTKMEIT